MTSNTGCTSDRELAITFRISDVAACCSRASFRSLLGPETERRLTRVAASAVRCSVRGFRPFPEPALCAFAPFILPPVLDARAISAPKGQHSDLIGLGLRSGRGASAKILRAGRPEG